MRLSKRKTLNKWVERHSQCRCFHTGALHGTIKQLTSTHAPWHVDKRWAGPVDSHFLPQWKEEKIPLKEGAEASVTTLNCYLLHWLKGHLHLDPLEIMVDGTQLMTVTLLQTLQKSNLKDRCCMKGRSLLSATQAFRSQVTNYKV